MHQVKLSACITVTSHERHGVFIHRQIDYFSTACSGYHQRKSSKFRTTGHIITGSHHVKYVKWDTRKYTRIPWCNYSCHKYGILLPIDALFNSSCAEMFSGNTQTYFDFLPVLHTEMMQMAQIHPHWGRAKNNTCPVQLCIVPLQ